MYKTITNVIIAAAAIALLLFASKQALNSHLFQVHNLLNAEIGKFDQQRAEGQCLDADTVYAVMELHHQKKHKNILMGLVQGLNLEEFFIKQKIKDLDTQFFESFIYPNFHCHFKQRAEGLIAELRQKVPDTNKDWLEALSDYVNQWQQYKSFADDWRIDLATKKREFANVADYLLAKPPTSLILSHFGANYKGISTTLSSKDQHKVKHSIEDMLYLFVNQTASAEQDKIFEAILAGENLLNIYVWQPNFADGQRLLEWLEYIDEQWLLAEQTPCEKWHRTLMDIVNSVDSSQLDKTYEETIASLFSESSCTNKAFDIIQSLDVQPLGPLVEASENGLGFTYAWRNEYRHLDKVLALDFIRLETEDVFQCKQVNDLEISYAKESIVYLQEYGEFLNEQNISLDDYQPNVKYLSFVNQKLEDVVGNRLASVFVAENASNKNTDQEAKIQQASQSFASMLNDLIMLNELLVKFKLDELAQYFSNCISNNALQKLHDIRNLINALAIYKVDIGNKTSDAEIKDYLSAQIARVAFISQQAEPYTRFMINVNNQNNVLVDFWRNTLAEINRFQQSKDSLGQVARLHDFITNDINQVNLNNCSQYMKNDLSDDFQKDLFSYKRKSLERELKRLCLSRQKVN